MIAMDSSKITALLLILILSISSTPSTLACGSCRSPTPETPKGPILPPVIVPPIIVPPIIGGTPPTTVKPGCSPPPQTCPIDGIKLGACIDCLGNEIHLGDPAVQCCPLMNGLAGVAAAGCMCTTMKAKLLDINVYLPLMLKLLITCGISIPPGYTCPN